MRLKSTKEKGLFREAIAFTLLFIAIIAGALIYQNNRTTRWKFNSIKQTEDAKVLAFVKEEHSLSEVLEFFQDRLIFLSVRQDAATYMPDSIRTALEEKGSKKIQSFTPGNAFALIIDKGRIVREKVRSKSPVKINYDGYQVISGGKDSGNQSSIKINGRTIESQTDGLNIYVCQRGQWNIYHYTFPYHQSNSTYKSTGLGHRLKWKELPYLHIKLSAEEYEQLLRKRNNAVRQGVLLTSSDDFVNTKLSYGEENYKAQLRLKGDWTDHLESDKWSFRIKLGKDDAIMGMRKFSLHHPRTRNYAGEWLFHDLLSKEGILHLQYHFVQVGLEVEGAPETSKFLGIYALEEAFDKRLVERNERREGPILKFDEDPIWKERIQFMKLSMPLEYTEFAGNTDYESLRIVPFNEGSTIEDSTQLKAFRTARNLLKSFLLKEIELDEVFEVEQLAIYNAVCNLMGANHALIPHNYRLYYNPITSRLEPVGFDANAGNKEWYFSTYEHGRQNMPFMRAYLKALERITEKGYLEDLLNQPYLQEIEQILQLEFPEYQWQPQNIWHNASMLKAMLKPEVGMHAFLQSMEGDTLILMLESCSKFPIDVFSLQSDNDKTISDLLQAIVLLPNERKSVRIPLKKGFDRLYVSKKQKKTEFDQIRDAGSLKLLWTLSGSETKRTSPLTPWEAHQSALARSSLFRKKANADEFDFLSFDESTKTINCKKGNWQIDKTLIIPPGYTFRAGPGTTIELKNYYAKIISFSPVQLIGEVGAPFELKSGTQRGQGIIVLNTTDTSRIEQALFTNLSNPTSSDWAISGAVNFYNAPVVIKHSKFADNRSEDALNIIKTWFQLENCSFSNTQSDAFDGDFVEGTIANCVFLSPGNDAIDVSGSDITIRDVQIANAGDKGLSAGESSIMHATNIDIIHSEIAVTCKDKSTLKLKGANITNNRVAFAAFQKKPEFGAGSIIASDINYEDNEVLHLIEEGSMLKLNGALMPYSSAVIELLYGAEFGKSSK